MAIIPFRSKRTLVLGSQVLRDYIRAELARIPVLVSYTRVPEEISYQVPGI